MQTHVIDQEPASSILPCQASGCSGKLIMLGQAHTSCKAHASNMSRPPRARILPLHPLLCRLRSRSLALDATYLKPDAAHVSLMNHWAA